MEIGNLTGVPARERYEAEHLHVLPGVIDSQVHFREPGMEYKEDLGSGTAAACLGGVTSVLEMPNANPPTRTIEQLADKIKRSQGRVWTDIGFFVGGRAENTGDVSSLGEVSGCAGIKIFMGSSTRSLLAAADDILFKILVNSHRIVAIHTEDESRLLQRKGAFNFSDGGVAMYPIWRDPESALIATQRILKLSFKTREMIHVLHVSTDEEMAVLAQQRATATAEVTPQHLTLSAPAASAADSLLEAKNEALTIHRLKMPELLRKKFAFHPILSNLCFSTLRDAEMNIKRFRDSAMRQRWVGTVLLRDGKHSFN